MNEDTRKLILRIQGEDLAALWAASIDNTSEIDATLRVYRRQLSLLDRHLEDARRARMNEASGEAVRHNAVTLALQITDPDAPILTQKDAVPQVGRAHSRPKTLSMSKPAAPITPIINATATRSLSRVSDRSVTRFSSSAPPAGEQLDKRDLQDKSEPAFRREQVEETVEEAERKDEDRKQMNTSRIPVQIPQRLHLGPSRAQPVEDMSIHDILEIQDQKRVERMMTVAPGRPISVLYKALKTCHGSFDDAVDMVFRQEGNKSDMEIVDLTGSDIERNFSTPSAQHRLASKQQFKAPVTTNADRYSTKTKPTAIWLSTGSSAIAKTSLKRSADHFAAPDTSPSKRQTGTISKKGLASVPGSCVQKSTIRDELETLLQSFRSLPTPALRTKKKRRSKRGGYDRIRGLGPAPTALILGPRSEIPYHVSMTPGMPSDMIRPSVGHHDQRLGELQLDSFPQTLPRVPLALRALDVRAPDAANCVQRKQMLGEALYPKIQELQPQLAGKITGMLLGMNITELLSLTTDDTALRNKVEEALYVYNEYVEANRSEDG